MGRRSRQSVPCSRQSVRSVALATAMVMAANAAGYGAASLPEPGSDPMRHMAQPAPAQRWGAAESADQPATRSPNHTLPASLRSRYPELRFAQPEPPANQAQAVLPDPGGSDALTRTGSAGLKVTGSAATSAMTVQGSGSTVGGSEFLVGNRGGAAAAYLKFDNLVNQARFHTIYGVYLQLVNFDAASCKARSLTIHPVTAGWTAGTGSSYPGPAFGSSMASKSFAHGYIRTGQTRSECPAAGALIDLGAAGRALVQRWVNGQQANYGLSVRASATDTAAWKRFTGTSTANPPKLFITHSPYNAAYAIPKPVPEPPVLQNQAGKVKVAVTNLSAEAWAPGSYYLAYRAYRADTGKAVVQQRAANLTATVPRNGRVTLDATIQPLPEGPYFLDFTMVKTGGVVFTDQMVPPIRLLLRVYNIPPVVQELYPPNGYQVPTLTPLLWARAVDIDAPPGSTLRFKFEVCEQNLTGCFDSGYLTSTAWTVPAGKLLWGKIYQWRAFVKDATSETPSPRSAILTAVPQPDITSHLAGSPYGTQDKEFDPQIGNFSTAAVDAPVATVGPELTVVRTYNSLDPRRDSAFGAGWITRYDMRLRPDDDGSGNVVITYPDGQEVRFGRNPDGSYVPPLGRSAALTLSGGIWTLLDKARTSYQFAGTGRLIKISDAASRAVLLSYDSVTGKLSKATVSNSQSNTAGRSLRFTWTGAHVTSVSTDAAGGTWIYTYDGDLLIKVCAPGNACTTYAYNTGSHYRTAVMDSKPESYWRLGEPDGTAAPSEVAVNLGKDGAAYENATLGVAGPLAGTDNTAVTFNGTSSNVDLPKGTVKKSRDAAVELWFRIPATGGGGPLVGYQDKAFGTASTRGVPVLYVGTDGKLRGQFAGASIAPITSPANLVDGRWHHVVLSTMGATTTLYLDGLSIGTLAQTLDASLLTFNQIGAGYASTPASWPAWGAAAQRFFSGSIDEVAVYSHPLGAGTVATHHRQATVPADQVSSITLPGGRIAAAAEYDTRLDRVKEYTDGNGGTWRIGAPAVYGGADDLRRSVQVLDPANRSYLYEYDALASRLLRSGTPAGLVMRPEDEPGDPEIPPDPVEQCSQPDPGDPQFCTIPPSQTGGPVFVAHPLDGIAIRTFGYDDRGFANVITSENGDRVTLTHDDRGNVSSRRTCRTTTQCFTTYHTYPTTITDPFDPRNDLPTATRDGRSASATDNTYRTSYTYHPTGELLTQTSPTGRTVRHTYSTGTEVSAGGGFVPPGMVLTTTDPRGAVTRYGYYDNGDLAQVTEPSGLVTRFGYDTLGRKISETEVSDTYPDGVTTTYTYDGMSRLVSTTEPATTDAVTGVRHQQKTVTGYDEAGNPVRVEVSDLLGGDPARVTTMHYDESGRPVVVVDAEGNETSYGYDKHGNRTSMVDANGNRYDYAYTSRNMLAEVRLRDYQPAPGEPNPGEYLVLRSYSYDLSGRLTSDTDAMGRRLEYLYYGDDLVQRITLKKFHNTDGTTRDYVMEENTFDGAGNLTRQETQNRKTVVQHHIDVEGQVERTVADPGGLNRTTAYGYDSAGNVTRTTRSGNSSNVPWPVLATSEVVDFEYDLAGRVRFERVRGGSAPSDTEFRYDQRGLLTSTTDPNLQTSTFRYDELGRQVSTAGPAVPVESGGGPPQTVTPTRLVGYNSFDEQVAVKDERGFVSRSTYDRLGRVTSAAAPSYIPPSGGAALTPTARMRYDGVGNLTEFEDAVTNTIRYGYDRLNRTTSEDRPLATNSERAIWRYTYTRTGQPTSVTDPTGARVEATYDDLDRLVTRTEVERRPVADNFTARVFYDDADNPTSVVAPSGATTSVSYNPVGEALRHTDPSGVVTQYGYDFVSRRVRLADGLGRTERTEYDALGRVASESDQAPNGSILRSQSYTYDNAGNLLSATNALDKTTSYAYDAMGRLITQVEPVSATASITTRFGYDAAGNRTRYTDGRGHRTIHTFNSLGLAESVIEPSTAAHPNPADRTWTASYDAGGRQVQLREPGGVLRTRSYDAANRLTREVGSGAEVSTAERVRGYDAIGRLTGVNAPGGTNTYQYNDRGALLTAGGPSGQASFEYDRDGEMTSRTDAAGTSRFGYDKGRLATITDGLTGGTQQLGYNAAGDLSSIGYGSGLTRAFGYDDLARPTSDVLRNSLGQTVASVAYGYDLDDRLVRKTTAGTAGAGDNTYEYDDAGRLRSWTVGGKTTTYAWDDSGNRIRSGAKTATYDERNRLLSDGDYTYTYSARGTLSGRTSSGLTERYAFDAFNRLATAEDQTYTYDGLDRMASRNGVGFSYAGLGVDPVSAGTERYARGPDDELIAIAQGDQERLAISDRHGDVVAEIDPTKPAAPAPAESTGYDPFGAVIATAGQQYRVGYQGDYTDPDTKQVNMGARWYNPGTGSFTSRDNVTYTGGESALANRYLYAAGDPLGFSDPDGNWPCWSCMWKWGKKKVKKGARAVVKVGNFLIRGAGAVVRAGIKVAKFWGRFLWDTRGPIPRFYEWVLKKTGLDDVVKRGINKFRDWVGGKLRDWGKRLREGIRKLAAKFLTRRAKEAQERAVKRRPVDIIRAAIRPLVSGFKTFKTAVAHLAAKVAARARNVVADVAKSTRAIYVRAVEREGPVIGDVSDAVDSASELSPAAPPSAGDVADVVGDLTGVNDLKDCATKGDKEACLWTALTVVGFLAGGAPGVAIRGARAGAVVARHGDDLAKLARGGSNAGRRADDIPAGKACRWSPGSNSFTPETQVRMADGSTKPIRDVKIGDKVLATDPTTGRTSAQPVTDTIVGTGTKKLVELTFRAAKITATVGHPFYVPSKRQWIDAGHLVTGSQLRSLNPKQSAVVTSVRHYTALSRAHNLTIDNLHTYYIVAAAADVLVHNDDPCDPEFIYRTGSRTEGALTSDTGVSFRNSVSSSADKRQVFNLGDKVWAVDTKRLRREDWVVDNDPPGHVSVFASPDDIRNAIVPHSGDNFLEQVGLPRMEEPGSYKLPGKRKRR